MFAGSHVCSTACKEEVDVATVTLPIGLWDTALKPQVWHFGVAILVFVFELEESPHFGLFRKNLKV